MEDKALGKEFYSRKSMKIPGKKSFDWANPRLDGKFEDKKMIQKNSPNFFRPDENGESLHYAISPERTIEKNNSFRRLIGLDKPKTKNELNDFINEQEKEKDLFSNGGKLTDESYRNSFPKTSDSDSVDTMMHKTYQRVSDMRSPDGKYSKLLKAKRAGIKAEDAKAERDNEMKVAFDLMGLKGPKYGE